MSFGVPVLALSLFLEHSTHTALQPEAIHCTEHPRPLALQMGRPPPYGHHNLSRDA
jgi:hypothetical protein